MVAAAFAAAALAVAAAALAAAVVAPAVVSPAVVAAVVAAPLPVLSLGEAVPLRQLSLRLSAPGSQPSNGLLFLAVPCSQPSHVQFSVCLQQILFQRLNLHKHNHHHTTSNGA